MGLLHLLMHCKGELHFEKISAQPWSETFLQNLSIGHLKLTFTAVTAGPTKFEHFLNFFAALKSLED